MKTTPILLLTALLLTSGTLFAQQVLYDNGPDPGNIYGWPVNFGYRVADSFTVAQFSTVTDVNVSLYDVNIYDYPLSLDWRILEKPNGKVIAYGSTSDLRLLSGNVNAFLFYQWLVQFDIVPAVQLPAGTYWLEISNAHDRWATGVLWGVSNGPSLAIVSGNLGGAWKHGGHDQGGSESFQILGFPQSDSPGATR